mgnify:CR=1 FL=1
MILWPKQIHKLCGSSWTQLRFCPIKIAILGIETNLGFPRLEIEIVRLGFGSQVIVCDRVCPSDRVRPSVPNLSCATECANLSCATECATCHVKCFNVPRETFHRRECTVKYVSNCMWLHVHDAHLCSHVHLGSRHFGEAKNGAIANKHIFGGKFRTAGGSCDNSPG